MSISVIPTPLIEDPPIIYGFNYDVYEFVLGKKITFNVIIVDQNGTPLRVNQVTLSGDDYTAWGQDDMYVVEYICKTLGLVLKEPIRHVVVNNSIDANIGPTGLIEPTGLVESMGTFGTTGATGPASPETTVQAESIDPTETPVDSM